LLSPPLPAGQRTFARAAFASFEKLSPEANFSNTAFGGTEPKEAPYAGTGENSKKTYPVSNTFILLENFEL
jgi:hypothetical protein